jgi:sterol 24-C-methyltransferase
MNKRYSNYRLHAKIDEMSKYINLKKFIEGEKNSIDQIRSYFRINHWAYRHYHSQDGFMHFRISKNGCFSDEDIYHQPDSISEFIKDGDTVMELGCGQGANLIYLAHCHPKSQFVGVDLQPRKKVDYPENVTIYEQDYSSLPQIPDQSVDVVYAIETLVYCSDKEKVFREVWRVMKPGAVMIVYDYASKERFETYDPHIQQVIALLSKGGAAAMIESLGEWNDHFTNCGFETVRFTDYAENLLPDLKKLERHANRAMTRPWLARLEFALLPDQYVSNIILGYLGYDACKSGIGAYPEWVLKKV